MKRNLGWAALLLAWPSAVWANPSISNDFQSIMQWLTHETVQGLAFNAGSTFDPPDEVAPGRIQPDLSLGLGVVPLDKTKFPAIVTPALADINPQGTLPAQFKFPNLTLHMRLGLPNRWDFSVRAADMTIPGGFRITPKTTAEGQSNTVGLGLRKHWFGGDAPLLSVAVNYNYVFGHVNFDNEYRNLALADDFVVDSLNHGALAWNVSSLGLNAVVSQAYGPWTPFAGIGYNHMSGSVRGRLESDFQTPLIDNPVAEASARPEEYQGRLIFGTQLDRSRLSCFINGEVKIVGDSAGKTFIVSMGIAAPFHIGHVFGQAHHIRPLDSEESHSLRDSVGSAPAPRGSGPTDESWWNESSAAEPVQGVEINGEAKPVPTIRYRPLERPPEPRETDIPEADLIR